VTLDAGYSAGWKILGQARAAAGDLSGAVESYRRGIEVAGARGDRQAAKEMQVFLKRLEKLGAAPGS
jgi:cytochrome c-type biogenesis protein CcmH/NrfG